MNAIVAPRLAWPAEFPNVVVLAALSSRDAHPDLMAAKGGDREAAVRLALALAPREGRGWDALLQLAGTGAVLPPVTVVEAEGFNAIPDAFARLCALVLGLNVCAGEVIQSNRVGHTRANGWHRLVTPAIFEGSVESGRDYILVDDHVGLGGTLANLRGYVELHGGRVVGMTTLTESRRPCHCYSCGNPVRAKIAPWARTRKIEWRATFGFGLDCLTEVEGGYLARQLSVDDIREGMAAAAEQARRRGFRAVALDGGG